jgi:SNF2 family DNA or RNA helicase
MRFAPGSLVKARGREWVVLPGSESDLLLVRPLGGTDDETTGIITTLETVEGATFDLPDPSDIGDYRSCRLLRDALRLGFRSSAGPFRSFGQIAVDPRPYQLVPLLMALKLDPVRLLIADDVGIGKTIEACLIGKELMAQGEVERLAVLCPPHLAEQWKKELREKFHVDPELVLPSTTRRLERGLSPNVSIFDHYPHVVVSIDYIKSERRRDDFIRTAPELVIVDEAHGATLGAERGKQLRHELVSKLAADESRHMILVTATPHSGKGDAFRSLVALLSSELGDFPEDLSGKDNETNRRKLARHLIQRRRADIEHYLDVDTPFPDRQEAEETYKLSDEYKNLFDKVLAYARERVRDREGGEHRQRVRWWSALALLRSLASSPAAAGETLRNRAASSDTETTEEADEVGARAVLDIADAETIEGLDVAPGSSTETIEEGEEDRNRRRLREFAKEADALRGALDIKLQKGIKLVKELVADGFRPIVFCRFIPTAEYLAEELRKAMKGVEVRAVTGKLPPEERERQVLELGDADKHVLVATDCLSEGINLQEHFDAVMHYDLSWNPTRHEQREGRVDRFGQQRKLVRTLTYYGIDNRIDGIVLDVLIRKSKLIRRQLGISVPVPEDTDSVMEAVFEGLLLREEAGIDAQRLPGFDEYFEPTRKELHERWERAAEQEKRSRTMFAQETLKPDEVAHELQKVRAAIGSGADVERFFTEALSSLGAVIRGDGVREVDLSGVPRAVRDALGWQGTVRVTFDPASQEDTALALTRTAPQVEALASHVLDTALDSRAEGRVASRSGAIRTDAVSKRTSLFLLRFRFDLVARSGNEDRTQLAEDVGLLAFEGSSEDPTWLGPEQAEALLETQPTGNVTGQQASELVAKVVEGIPQMQPRIDNEARRRGDELLEAHERVREAARVTEVRYSVDPKLPVDVLGVYVFVPQPQGR